MRSCLWCEQCYLMEEDLIHHVLEAHPTLVRVNGKSILMDYYNYTCFCGVRCTDIHSHLLATGGIRQHVLEVGLQLEDAL